MNRETLRWLRTAEGQALLAELAASTLDDTSTLPTLTRLRARYTPEQARAAVEQTLLRQRARARFSQADRLYFIREALEQASSEPVARHRAGRFAAGSHIADLGCGIGGDTLALAAAGHTVTAVERDDLRLALAAANAEALGLTQRITFVQADVLTEPLPAADALFCDPGRRARGRRRFALEQYEPPISHVLRWRAQTPALAVKLSPGVDTAELATFSVEQCELEFVSRDGELKEAVLWCGPLATVRRRASVLHGTAPAVTLTDTPDCPTPPLAHPSGILYEPDPAVLRAGLVTHLAAQLGAAQLDASIAYLTAPTRVQTPFARTWSILEWLPFNLKRLRARLRELDAGTVTVKKRGSPLDSDRLARQLGSKGTQPLVVVLTKVSGQAAAIICAAR
jgi:protein-L-isoaspartate O-methyltransferase